MPRATKRIAEEATKHALHAARIMKKSVSEDEIMEKGMATWGDPTGGRLVELMDESGIDLTVICMVDDAGNSKLKPQAIQEGNRIVGDIARRYPGRVMALAGVDPRRPEARDMLKQCFQEFGVKGLKYHPDYGYDPAGSESYRLLEVVAENDGILLTHTGSLMPPSRCKFAEPLLLADLAVDFPNLKVIAAHMGGINWRPWASLAAHQPNLYGDLAMWDAYAFGHYELFCRELRDLLDYAGSSKVLFGTDNPIFNTVESTKNWIQLIKDLPNRAPQPIAFTEEEMNAILGNNAASVLGLTP
jgi:hypothetical protein